MLRLLPTLLLLLGCSSSFAFTDRDAGPDAGPGVPDQGSPVLDEGPPPDPAVDALAELEEVQGDLNETTCDCFQGGALPREVCIERGDEAVAQTIACLRGGIDGASEQQRLEIADTVACLSGALAEYDGCLRDSGCVDPNEIAACGEVLIDGTLPCQQNASPFAFMLITRCGG